MVGTVWMVWARESEPSTDVAARPDWGPWPGAGAWAGTYRGPRPFAPRKSLQITFEDPIEIRWTGDGCGGTHEPVGRADASRREYVARVTWGLHRCIGEGTVVLTRTGPAIIGLHVAPSEQSVPRTRNARSVVV